MTGPLLIRSSELSKWSLNNCTNNRHSLILMSKKRVKSLKLMRPENSSGNLKRLKI